MVRSNSQKQDVTMKDVATRASVSRTTVSLVLSNAPGANIPEETRRRIWNAANELGYRRNVLARSLRTSRSGQIGLISDFIATTPYAGNIVAGAQAAAWAHGMMLLLVDTEGQPEIEARAADTMLASQVEGIIYATMWHRPVEIPTQLRETPAVLLDCFDLNGAFPSVTPDEVSGGRTATQYLLRKGHRRIGLINNQDQVPATIGRFTGYCDALAAHGIAFDEQLVACGPISNGGYDCAMALMRLPDPPTALFCFNDHMAMAAYDALRKFGLRIPQDVAVVGFDNMEIIAAYLYPALTTMQLPHYDMGVWAVEHLLEQCSADEEVPIVQHKLPCPLVERASA